MKYQTTIFTIFHFHSDCSLYRGGGGGGGAGDEFYSFKIFKYCYIKNAIGPNILLHRGRENAETWIAGVRQVQVSGPFKLKRFH